MLYWTCPECGANLDIGEKCEDCTEKEIKNKKGAVQSLGSYDVQQLKKFLRSYPME